MYLIIYPETLNLHNSHKHLGTLISETLFFVACSQFHLEDATWTGAKYVQPYVFMFYEIRNRDKETIYFQLFQQ
jgi:hypothetical protein